MTRVLIGDALINENDRLQTRINQLHDRLEATLKQALRFAVSEREITADLDISAQANMLMCYVSWPLASICQKRLQARPDGILGSAAQSNAVSHKAFKRAAGR